MRLLTLPTQCELHANSLPQFGAIVAVSREGSPRRESLIVAANITEIDITIPRQPQWTDADVLGMHADKDSRITRGSALAWLGHLNALRWFLSTNLETMLVIEDDVDWDIHLRTYQIPKAAHAIRQLVKDQTNPPGQVQHNVKKNNFWGNVSAWDLLYLGHCGDIFRPSDWQESIPRLMYEDKSLPAINDMHPHTTVFVNFLQLPEYHRMIHQSIFPLCTFAFALTRNGAHRLLTEIAPKERDGGTMAYDVRVVEGCRPSGGLRCWSANPELFHHMSSKSEIEAIDRPDADSGADKGVSKPDEPGDTANIACGVRSKEFFTREQKALKFLRQRVGREGVCLKDEGKVKEPKPMYTGLGDSRMYQ